MLALLSSLTRTLLVCNQVKQLHDLNEHNQAQDDLKVKKDYTWSELNENEVIEVNGNEVNNMCYCSSVINHPIVIPPTLHSPWMQVSKQLKNSIKVTNMHMLVLDVYYSSDDNLFSVMPAHMKLRSWSKALALLMHSHKVTGIVQANCNKMLIFGNSSLSCW